MGGLGANVSEPVGSGGGVGNSSTTAGGAFAGSGDPPQPTDKAPTPAPQASARATGKTSLETPPSRTNPDMAMVETHHARAKKTRRPRRAGRKRVKRGGGRGS